MNEIVTSLPVSAPAERRAKAAFTGQNGDFRRLVTRGTLFELVTCGFYRFWLAARTRRHLWTHTELEGDAFEYTGTGRELLIGFLFALAVLVPFYLAYFLVGLEAERLKAFASLPLVVFIYGFSQFAVYRARRYRLNRTTWRGIRFWMDGSGIGYACRAFGWAFLVGLTLGLAHPWREASLERYKMRHTHYGDLPGRFEGTGGTFFKRGWWIWALSLIPIAGYGLLIGCAAYAGTHAKTGGLTPAATALVTFGILTGLLSFVLIPFLYGAYKATEWKWWLEGVRFGALSCTSDLRRGQMIGNYWKLIGVGALVTLIVTIVMVPVGLFGGFLAQHLGVDFAAWGTQMKAGHIPPLMIVAYLLAYLPLILAISIVNRIYLVQRIWKMVVNSVTVCHIEEADAVAAKGDLVNALGEGLADGLDVAAF